MIPRSAMQARAAVRDAARRCGNHPSVFAMSVVNEIPSELVRFIGREAVEGFIDELVCIAKAEAPNCLVTFANYPTTEYLRPRWVDFVCFNVYLDSEVSLPQLPGAASEYGRRHAARHWGVRGRYASQLRRGPAG